MSEIKSKSEFLSLKKIIINHTSNQYSNSRLLLVVAVALFSIHHVYCGGDGEEVQWQILTKLNYSTHIRLHPHLLLLVTVPWSGESRSLMTELANVVASDQVKFGTLKLMVLYRNVERMLADALGATEGITFFYYHNALSYKYWGKLRVQSILSSVHYVMSLSPDELPLKILTTPGELRDFLDSTDNAVLLLEFCGWVPRLLAKDNNMTENDLDEANFYGENNGTLAAEEKADRKGIGNDKLNCGIDNGFSGFSWLSQFTSVNDSLMKEAENLTFRSGVSCSLDEFQHFELYLQKFITVSREFFLPRERHRFALVCDRSLLSLLNIEESGSWSMAVYFAGCPSCSKVLGEVDELITILKTHTSPVLELEDDFHGVEATFPAKGPTLLLFVDRSSDSMQIRTESQGALNAFRELAYEMSNQIHGQANLRPDKPSTETNQASWSALKHPSFHPFPASQNLILEDKMSIMIMNEGKQVTLEDLVSDLQGSSMHEILTCALKQKKEIKLSSVAKDAGLQLLSKDLDIEVVESLPPHSDVQPDQVLGEPLVEGRLKNTVNVEKNQLPAVSSSGQCEELPNPSDAEYILLENKEESLDKSSQSSVKSENGHHYMGMATDSAQDGNVETRLSKIDNNTQQKYFRGSFFFFDGQYGLLETLTGGSKIPSVIIIDPISQKHYVVAEQSDFSYSLLSDFVNSFHTGKLLPYQKSAPIVPSPREAPRPPFVNLDYHEKDSIPLVTTHTFAELVLGNKSDPKNSGCSWDRNILVLFSNSWCGFCQRMELVVREVYRAILGYANLKMNSSRMEKLMLTGEHIGDATLRLPLIYMMDCTQNDCGLIVKPILQRELYPLLLLFPAERKKNTVPYEGDIGVSDLIKFLSAHGSHVLDLLVDKSYLQDQSSVKQVPLGRSVHHGILLKDRLQNVGVKHNQISARFPVGSHERPQLSVGCVLGATERLLDVHPFDESKILLVKVEQKTGFQGLIINKHMSWDSLEEGFDLLKEAPLSFGGPVVRRGMPLVALTLKFIENQSVEILPDIYFVDQWATQTLIEEIEEGNQSVHDYWFFLGYSSWGWDQLFHEIAQGAWNVSNGNLEQLKWPWR